MIAFQWRPPWNQLASTSCKHSRSIAKGKAPENCICLRVPARNASNWSRMAFAAGGAEASTSTLAPASSDADLLYFYPSYYFDIPRFKSRSFKHVRRALKRTLGLSRTMLPNGSTSRQQIFAETRPPPLSAAWHSSATLSDVSRVDKTPSASSSPFEALPYRKSRKQMAYEDRHSQDTSTNQSFAPQSVAPSSQASGKLREERSLSHAQETSIRTPALPSSLNWEELSSRVQTKLLNKAPLQQTRWRLYALLRLADRYIISQRIWLPPVGLRALVLKVCKLHLSTIDIPHIEEIIRKFERLSTHHPDLGPNVHIYNTLLVAYCRALRVHDAYRLLDKLRKSKLGPTGASYLALVTMHAHLKDPENAQELLEAMDRDNIPILQKIYTSLMNAYVEAGFWDEAIRIFDFLDSHSDGHPLKPDIHTCTTLLKCYVLMSAPLDDVMHVFNLIQNRGLQPSMKTYALVLCAACDAGAIDFAEEVFARLDEDDGQSNVTVFTFTIMIRGLLRAGKQEAANEYYQEMRRRGLEPTSATWSVLMQAYTKTGEPQNNALLTDLLNQYLDTYLDAKTGRVRPRPYSEDNSVARGAAVENVYGPVITALGKSAGYRSPSHDSDKEESLSSAQAALSMFSQMLAHSGNKPSLHLYTALLDAYRRVDDINGVQALWSHIVTYARELAASASSTLSGSDDSTRTLVSASRRNFLCLPLSIYIEAMSTHHRHEEVAQAWQELQSLGFGFDVGNWNHLIAAFVRAGEIDRALWIAEDLLRNGQIGDSNPPSYPENDNADQPPLSQAGPTDDSFTTKRKSVIASEKAETPMRPPNRTWQYHQARKEKLRNQWTPVHSLEDSIQPKVLRDDKPARSQDGNSSPVVIEKEAVHEMTAGYPTLRQEHHAQTWTLFSSTVRILEEAMRRELTEMPSHGVYDQKASMERGLDELQARRREDYPLTMAAIDAYRINMRIKS